jgi:tetratricopeptide (TPR) repeat protein
MSEPKDEYIQSLKGLYEQMMRQSQDLRRRLFESQARDLALEVKRSRESDPDFANKVNRLAVLYDSMGKHVAAEPLYRQALELRRRQLGEGHPDVAETMKLLAGMYETIGNYAAAEPLLRKVLQIRRQWRRELHPDLADALDRLAGLYRVTANQEAADTLSRHKAEMEQIARLNQETLEFFNHGAYVQAMECATRAWDMASNSLGEENAEFAISLNNLALLYRALGDYAKAEPLFRQGIEITRRFRGGNHPDLPTTLSNLGVLYRSMGKYQAAEPLYREALELRRRLLGEEHPDVAMSLNNLGLLFKDMCDFGAAEKMYRQALELYRRVHGDDHSEGITIINNLGELYRTMGNYAGAALLHSQALELRRRVLGDDHCDVAESLNNLASAHHGMGDYGAAEKMYRQALELYRRVHGDDHPNVAHSLNNLAGTYRAMGNYAEAEPLLRRALELRRSLLGDHHPDVADSLYNLAILCVSTRREADALNLMREGMLIDDQFIGQVFSIASERQRMAFMNRMQANLFVLLSLVCQHMSMCREATLLALDLILRRKAILLEALMLERDTLLISKHPELQHELQELRTLRMQIAQKTLAGPGPEGSEAHQQLLSRWNAHKEQLEAGLACQLAEINLQQKLRAADRRAVALSLPEGVVLIEFVRFGVFDFNAVQSQRKADRYLAFVLHAGQPEEAQMIDLGDAAPIDRLIADFRASILGDAEQRAGRDLRKWPAQPRQPDTSRSGLALRETLFDRLLSALAGSERLLIAPDGDLARLPFELIPNGEEGRLLDAYQFSYVACGRDVLRFGMPAELSGPPIVIADPAFDLDTKATATSQQKRNAKSAPATPRAGWWSRWFGRSKHAGESQPTLAQTSVVLPPTRRSRDLTGSGYHFGRLAGTRVEGERVSVLLGVQGPWFDTFALEGRLKKESRSPRILHLATHGFFLEDSPHDNDEEQRNWNGSGRLSGPLPESPLLRSGLALAGANTWLQGGSLPDDAEDGLLTAEDVTGLDLTGTELVVLSACETGLGQIHVGEGVFGLRRSFTLAGAKTLIMSLWSVPDEPTLELMVDYYQRILSGDGRADALRNAQLSLRAKYPDPYYWGAFICQGDPGPLRR